MKDIDMKLYETFQDYKNTMPRGALYYVLLDWCDQHHELRQKKIKKADRFLVSYFLENNYYEKVFTAKDYLNPYIAGRNFINKMLKDYSSFEYQFEALPNPYRTGEDGRMGRILMTNMKTVNYD